MRRCQLSSGFTALVRQRALRGIGDGLEAELPRYLDTAWAQGKVLSGFLAWRKSFEVVDYYARKRPAKDRHCFLFTIIFDCHVEPVNTFGDHAKDLVDAATNEILEQLR